MYIFIILGDSLPEVAGPLKSRSVPYDDSGSEVKLLKTSVYITNMPPSILRVSCHRFVVGWNTTIIASA
jgi:hypothetical protein